MLTGDLTVNRYRKFLSSIQTISNEIERDLYLYSNNKLQLSKFLIEYGHLRPGTYEIENFSYSEKPNIYFKKIKGKKILKNKHFVFKKKEKLSFKKFLKMINSIYLKKN